MCESVEAAVSQEASLGKNDWVEQGAGVSQHSLLRSHRVNIFRARDALYDVGSQVVVTHMIAQDGGISDGYNRIHRTAAVSATGTSAQECLHLHTRARIHSSRIMRLDWYYTSYFDECCCEKEASAVRDIVHLSCCVLLVCSTSVSPTSTTCPQ